MKNRKEVNIEGPFQIWDNFANIAIHKHVRVKTYIVISGPMVLLGVTVCKAHSLSSARTKYYRSTQKYSALSDIYSVVYSVLN